MPHVSWRTHSRIERPRSILASCGADDIAKNGALEVGLVSEPSAPLFVGCGAVAGVGAQTLVYPLDVVRRRQMQATPDAGVAAGMGATLKAVVRQGGLRALWAGIVPAYLRVAPAVATSLLVRDAILGRLRTQQPTGLTDDDVARGKGTRRWLHGEGVQIDRRR